MREENGASRWRCRAEQAAARRALSGSPAESGVTLQGLLFFFFFFNCSIVDVQYYYVSGVQHSDLID